MNEIRVYAPDNEDISEILFQVFPRNAYRVTVLKTLEKIIEACSGEIIDLVMVWSVRYQEIQALFQQLARQKLDYIPVCALVRDKQELSVLLEFDFADCIQIPISPEEFYQVVKQVLEDTGFREESKDVVLWRGRIKEYGLTDLMQMVKNDLKNSELIVTYRNKYGRIYFREGDIVHAQFRSLEGMDAILKMFFLPEGNFLLRRSESEVETVSLNKSSGEILFAINEKLLRYQKAFQGLPGALEEVMLNPLVPVRKLTALQNDIANLCKRPVSILDILLSLEDDNENILTALQGMLRKDGMMGRKQDVQKLIHEVAEKNGFSKLVSSISAMLFKKKLAHYESSREERYSKNQLPHPQLERRSVRLGKKEFVRIGNKLKGLSK